MSTRRKGAIKVGTVTSDKMEKSVVVQVSRIVLHPAYKRYVKRSAKFMAHDEKGACRIGDTVEIVECRPMSARKRWRVRRVLRTGVAGAHEDTPGGP